MWQSKDVDAESPDRDPLRNPVDIDLGKGATQKFNFQASRTQTLFYPWQGANVGVMGLLTGQWSDSILPPL